MVFQAIDWTRIFTVYIIQLFLSIFFLFLAQKILKRNRTRITLTLSVLYISIGIGFALNAIFLLISTTPSGYIIYFIIVYRQL